MTPDPAATVSISSADGLTLQRLSRAGGYAGPNDGVPGPSTWRGLQQTVKGYGYTGSIDGLPGSGTYRALQRLGKIPLSLPCWQGDDVGGFENQRTALGGGLAVTGGYRGKARDPDELRSDLDKTLSLIPGRHRVNLHAMYGEFGGQKVDRDEIEPAHFRNWIDWAKKDGLGLDFNPTCFSHPKVVNGLTLSHRDQQIRQFWIEHCRRSREIGAAMGKALGRPCVTNVWIPDGFKEVPNMADAVLRFRLVDRKPVATITKAGAGGLDLLGVEIHEPTLPIINDVLDAAAKLRKAGKAVPRDANQIIVQGAML